MSANKEQVKAAIEAVRAVADAIRSLKRVPPTILYSAESSPKRALTPVRMFLASFCSTLMLAFFSMMALSSCWRKSSTLSTEVWAVVTCAVTLAASRPLGSLTLRVVSAPES